MKISPIPCKCGPTEITKNEAPVLETMRYAILRNAEPKNGWCNFKDHVTRNIQHPENLKQFNIEGTINVQFVVTEDGKIDRVRTAINNPIKARESQINSMKEEARIAVIESFGEWRPSTIYGVPVVSSTFSIPVSFKVDYPAIR